MRVKTEQKRREIIEVAKQVFRAKGFAAASMAEIAADVGGSKGTLYNYFTSKEALFAAVMIEMARELADPIFSELVHRAHAWVAEHGSGRITDPRSYAALLVAMELGSLVLREQLSRELGADVLSRAGYLTLARAKVEFYSEALLAPEAAGRAREAIDRLAEKRDAKEKPGEEDRDDKRS